MATDNKELTAKITSKAPNLTPAQQIKAYLEKHKEEFVTALPKHVSADRMLRLALTEIRTSPKLLNCSIQSLMAGVMKASIDGLEFGTGQCYLVPYGNEATYQRGYQGIIKLVRNSGDLVSISADVVHENDDFVLEKGFEPKCSLRPNYENPGKVIGYLACALLKDGGRQAEFMTVAQVDKIKARSKTANSSISPWRSDYDEMAKKTVLRRLCKLLPITLEIQQKLSEEDDTEFKSKLDIDLGEGQVLPAITDDQVDAVWDEMKSVPPVAPFVEEED